MTLVLTMGLRLALWGLLTGDPGVLNLSIGLAVALLLPRSRRPLPLGAFWAALGQALAAIPQAYGEAFQLLLARRHRPLAPPWLPRPRPRRLPPRACATPQRRCARAASARYSCSSGRACWSAPSPGPSTMGRSNW
jgi:hypothetical protein